MERVSRMLFWVLMEVQSSEVRSAEEPFLKTQGAMLFQSKV
jgi:hypothetical protein